MGIARLPRGFMRNAHERNFSLVLFAKRNPMQRVWFVLLAHILMSLSKNGPKKSADEVLNGLALPACGDVAEGKS